MKKIALYLIITLFMVSISSFAQENKDVSLEDKTKAAFIYNFTRYIEWTDDTTETFTIAVIGDSDILIPLKEIGKKKLVGKRKIRIKHYRDISEMDTCHILFISESEDDNLQEILDAPRDKNVLTISDTKGFAHKGVAINFVIIKEKIRFQINSTVLDILELRVSSQLLKLALFVKGKKKHD